MDKVEVKERILALHFQTGVSAAELAAQFNQAVPTVYRWLQQARAAGLEQYRRSGPAPDASAVVPVQVSDSEEVKRLKQALSEAQLLNKYYRAVIDIAQDEMGIDVEKKRGAKR